MAHFNAKNFDEVKSFIENEYSKQKNKQFTVLNSTYENNRTPMEVEDSDGYKYSMSYGLACSGYKANAMPRIVYKNNSYSIHNIKNFIRLNNEKCEILSESFHGDRDKLSFRCNCGNIFETSWTSFFSDNKRQCNKCGRGKVKLLFAKSNEEVKKYLSTYGLTLDSKYENCKSNINVICSCGEKFSTTFSDISSSKYKCCHNCTMKIKNEYTKHDRYEKIRKYIDGDGRKLLTTESEFENSQSKINVLCSCGNKYSIIATLYNKQCSCPKCSSVSRINKRRMNNDEIKDIIQKYSDSIGVHMSWYSGIHKNNSSHITLIDDIGYKYYTTVSNINSCIDGQIYKFAQSNPYTVDNIKIWMKDNATNYELLSNEYISAKDYLQFKCPDGHIFKMNWDNFKQGQRCPECKLSKGARMVLYHLRSLNLNFDIEYWFKDCRGSRKPLPFDFAIFDDNRNVSWLCEFDGELHYEPSRFSSDSKKNLKVFRRTQRYDSIKTKYCSDNVIPLLRIPYWERDNGNVENIINEFINNLHIN